MESKILKKTAKNAVFLKFFYKKRGFLKKMLNNYIRRYVYMEKIPYDQIINIQRKVNIVDVISGYLPIEQRGKNYFAICPFHDDHNPSMDEMKSFLQSHTNDLTPTLVFVPNCWALPIVFTAMKELKLKIPHVGLIGFDNIEWSDFSSPTVTTIVQPAFREGQEAMNLLIDQIEGTDLATNQRILDCQIHWKESTH